MARVFTSLDCRDGVHGGCEWCDCTCHGSVIPKAPEKRRLFGRKQKSVNVVAIDTAPRRKTWVPVEREEI